jgi:hypothetical protein
MNEECIKATGSLNTILWISVRKPERSIFTVCIVLCHDLWHSGPPKQEEIINQSNCSHWFHLITAICFGPYLGPSSGSFIKYVSCYWNILIWSISVLIIMIIIMHVIVNKNTFFLILKLFSSLQCKFLLSSRNVCGVCCCVYLEVK